MSSKNRLASVLAATFIGSAALVFGSAATAHAQESPLHSGFDQVLKSYTDDGRVDYKGLAANDDALERYLTELQAVNAQEFATWSEQRRLAFWINAYNAFTIRWVLDHFPTEGIWKTVPIWKRATGGPFAVAFIELGHLAGPKFGPKLSLNDVEHEIIRREFTEPRSHFALVCASTSCPKLRGEAYVAGRLSEQLDDNARDFLRDPAKNRYDPTSGRLEVSKIFDWFEEDFAGSGGPLGYFRRYGPEDAVEAMARSGSTPRVKFATYNWSLND